MSEIRIRPATLDDAAAIAAVQVASWLTTYRGLVADEMLAGMNGETRTEAWRENLQREGQRTLLAEEDREGEPTVIGFAGLGPNRSTEPPFDAFSGELYAIYLLASHQRGGTGTRLVSATVDGLLELGLESMIVWVLETNPARAFYEALGGRLIGSHGVEIGGVLYPDVAYGWDDLEELRRRFAG